MEQNVSWDSVGLASPEFSRFSVEPESSMPYSQDPATESRPDPDKFDLNPHNLFL
jgi:hypothetical protein